MLEKIKHPAQLSESGHYLNVINIRQFGGREGGEEGNEDRSEISMWVKLRTSVVLVSDTI